jgi:hypothetical protein
MNQNIQELIEKSGKRSTVTYKGKDKRVKFDENFGKEKLNKIISALGDDDNKALIFQKLSK